MNENTRTLIQALAENHSLTLAEYETLITARDQEAADLLAQLARTAREAVYGTAVYTRGLIEISNICKNDCLYCGIRGSNANCDRYRLTPEDILHLRPSRGRGRLFHRPGPLPPDPGDQKPLPRLRRDPLPGGAVPGELSAAL